MQISNVLAQPTPLKTPETLFVREFEDKKFLSVLENDKLIRNTFLYSADIILNNIIQ
jgi:hypothetical protein